MSKTEIDFNDEEAVLAEMAAELDIDPDELKIKESHLGSFGAGTVYEITIRDGGHKEWNVVENDDAERELALAIVKQDLNEQPEIFDQDFIEHHIDTDQLRRDLESDVVDMNVETLRDRDADEFWKEWEGEGFVLPENAEPVEDEEADNYGEQRDPTESEIDELARSQAEERLRDPMEYLEDIYGKEDAVKQAIKIAGIDIDAAAEEAVDTDGAGHFLSSYDGSTYETKNGLVYWRTN